MHLLAVLLASLLPGITSSLSVLLLGGSGFVGSAVLTELLESGHSVTTASRSGAATSNPRHTSLKLDLTSPSALAELPPFDAYVHCVGVLFDSQSALSRLNKVASGSGSEPGGTYDQITAETVKNLCDALPSPSPPSSSPPPLDFISAFEVGWPQVTGGSLLESLAPPFLRRYLSAKRRAEATILSAPCSPHIMRPSIIYVPGAGDSKLTVNAFTALSFLPPVEKPIPLPLLARAVARACEGNGEGGVYGREAMGVLGEETKM
jgi:nucleoside-diphosphate-sugar epimerase